MFKYSPWNIVNTCVIVAIHLAALASIFMPLHKIYFLLFIANYLWFGFSSSLYFHRYLTHRSFELVLPLQLFFLLGGLIGLGGDPTVWVSIHRYHHSHADVDADSHSPLDGFWYSYIFWQMKIDLRQVEKWKYLSDDLKKMWPVQLAQGIIPSALAHLAYAALIYSQVGLPGLLFGLYLPLVMSYQFCWMLIASLCHTTRFGVRNHNTPDLSRNICWLGPLSFGESFHNNHHENPRRLRHGRSWFDIDLTAWFVILLEKLKLAKSIVK